MRAIARNFLIAHLLLGCAFLWPAGAAAQTRNLIASLPDFQGPYDSSAPFPFLTIGTFTYALVPGESVTGATASGTWGNDYYPQGSAGADVYLDGILVAQCIANTTCWFDAPPDRVPWSYTFTTAQLANLNDGQAVLTAQMTSSLVVELGDLRLALTIASPPILTVAGGGTGSGVVTSQAGLSPAINCTIANGVAAGGCSQNYPAQPTVTLTATPTGGSTFGGWTGPSSGSCSGTTCTLPMTLARAVTATFTAAPPTYSLTISKAGSGSGTVSTSPGGNTCDPTCLNQLQYFAAGTPITLSASESSGSVFSGWSGGGCSGSGTCTFTLNAPTNITATFALAPTQTLTVAKTGTGTGTVTSSPSGINCGPTCTGASTSFNTGTDVTLTYAVASGSVFSGWSGGCSGTGSCRVTMNSPISVTASFSPAPTYALTLSKSGTGSGTVTSSPSGISCGPACTGASTGFSAGTVVTLTATPASGSTFAGWSGGGCPVSGTCTVTMNAATSVTATFTLTTSTYTLTVAKAGSGFGSVTSSPSGILCDTSCTLATSSFNAGTAVTLTASAVVGLNGSVFMGWSGGGCSGIGACTVTMNAATTVTASFAPGITSSLPPGGIVSQAYMHTFAASVPTGSPAPSWLLMTGGFPPGLSLNSSSGVLSGTPTSAGSFPASVFVQPGTSYQSFTITITNPAPATRTLDLLKAGTGSGTVDSSPGGINCGPTCASASATFTVGTTVTLAATASSGSSFAGWSGACTGTGTCSVTLDANRSVTATFSVAQAASPVFPMTVTTSITPTVSTATATIQFRPQDVGKTGSVYVFAVAPSDLVKSASGKEAMVVGKALGMGKADPPTCVVAQLSSTGQLVAVTYAQLQAFSSGTLLAQGALVSILNNVPTPAVAGATFYVGYGASGIAMINEGIYQSALTVPGGSVCPMPSSQTALWWNPAESGWGVNLNHQGNILFGTLFTYDANRTPLWLVMSNGAIQSDGVTFTGDLFQTRGPPFNANPFAPIGAGDVTKVGTMTVSFQDVHSGTLRYSVNGVEVAKAIQRQVFGSRAAACFPTTASRATATNYQDLWWNAAESGWGINLTHQEDTIFATLFTYDAARRGLWLVMSSGLKQADGSYAGDLYQTRGPPFNANPFTPIGSGDVTNVGRMSLRFSDGINGTLTYTYNGAPVTKQITRQVFSSPVPACN